MLSDYLNKPYYLYRPTQALRRVWAFLRPPLAKELQTVVLPWGWPIRFHSRDVIGRALLRNGVFELPVSEALCRLANAGELCFDVGANIGYMSAVLASRGAQVVAFEPMPSRCTPNSWPMSSNGRTRAASPVGPWPSPTSAAPPP